MVVETGGIDDGRHRGRQLALAALGWVLIAALTVWLALDADQVNIRVSVFLTTVAAIIALTATLIAIDLLRPRLIQQRQRPTRALHGDSEHDALGRTVDLEGVDRLDGEFTIDEDLAIRHYNPVT